MPVLVTLAFFGALFAVRRRHRAAGGDERLAAGAGVVLVLFGGGLAGGIICLVGQTFAMPFIDPALYRADVALGVDLESMIRSVTRVHGLPELLAVAYNSSVPLVFINALAFAWTARFEQAWELCAIFNLCLIVATMSSAIIPATGPFHHLAFPEELRNSLPPGSGTYHLSYLFTLREADLFVIDPSRLEGVATFPSFHIAMALLTGAAWRDVRWVRAPMYAWQGLVILSTIPIGGHYAIDLLAGAACWALAQYLCSRGVAQAASKSRTGAIAPAMA